MDSGPSQSSGAAPSLRQSSRTKKPSRRAEEMQHAELAETAVIQKRQKADEVAAKAGGKTTSRKKGAAKEATEDDKDDDGGEYEQGSEEEDQDDQNGDEDEEQGEEDENGAQSDGSSQDVFCLCKKGDDGRPMVFCAECNDWFHFKCVDLTKKVAERLSEYICPPCETKTGKKSKTLDDSGAEEEDEEKEGSLLRSSLSSKRKSIEEEGMRKRSRNSPLSPSTRKPTSATPTRPTPTEQSRRSSGSHNAPSAPTGSTAVIKARSDTLRKHAVEQLVSTFDPIFAEQTSVEGSESKAVEEESKDAESQETKGRAYAVAFESSLFDLHSESVAKTTIRTAGKNYRDRLRTFLFNLKDKSNTTLRQKIASKELSASELAGMRNEELANDEIRKEVERRKRENLEQSILKKEKAPLRKLTHKGEIDIEYEAVHSSRIAEEREREGEQAKVGEAQAAAMASEATRKEESTPDREGSARSPPAPLPLQGSPSVPHERRISSSLQSPTVSFDFANVWGAGEAPPEGDDEEEEITSQGGDQAVGEDSKQNNGGDEGEVVQADNFIDDFLGMPEGNEPVDEHRRDQNAGDEGNEDDDEESDDGQIAWRGALSMPEEGVLTGKVRQVAGRALLDHEWGSLFASQYSIIEGRLPSGTAAPYLVQSRVAFRTELVVMTLEDSWEPDALKLVPAGAPSNKEESKAAFERLLAYFQRRDRYGVLPPLAAARGRFVKDFYIAPLPKDVHIPQWLEQMQAPAFQGEAAVRRRRDMFLLVAVLFKQAPRREDYPGHQPLSTSYSPPGPATSASGEMSPHAHNLSTILGGPGSTTLQDLLKAVGGSKNTASPAAGGHQSPNTAAQQAGSQSTTHPSIESLSEMPKPQLEDMLHNNPNLVDQLLKTLGAGKTSTPSAAGPPRPPGPPPPPPPIMSQHSQQQHHAPAPHMPMAGQQHHFAPGGYASPPTGYPPPEYSYPAQQSLPPPQRGLPPQGLHPRAAQGGHGGGFPPADHGWRSDNGYARNGPHNQPPSGYGGPPVPPPTRGGHRDGPSRGRRRY